MKKFTKNKYTNSALLAVAGMLFVTIALLNTSLVTAQENQSPKAFLGESSTLQQKIGSLAVRASSGMHPFFASTEETPNDGSALWILDPVNNCISRGFDGLFTCLDIDSAGIFAQLLVDNIAKIYGTSTVPAVTVSSTVVDNDATALVVGGADPELNSIMVSSLARYDLEDFAPRDETSNREICVDNTGAIGICVTQIGSWITGDWSACDSGTQTRTVTCIDDETEEVLFSSSCRINKPATSQSC